MENNALLFGSIGLGCLAIAVIIAIIRPFLKVLLRLLACLALLISPVSIMVGFAHNPIDKGMILGGVALFLFSILVFRRKRKKVKREKKSSKSTIQYRNAKAFVAAIESKEATIDANLRAVFTDIAEQLQSIADEVEDDNLAKTIEEKGKLLGRISAAKVKGSKEPSIHDLDELSELVEDGRAKIDPTTRMVLKEVYTLVDSLEMPDSDDGQIDDASMLSVTLEQILYPSRID